MAENENLDPDHFYCTKDGFVWGLEVPGGINHANEGVDFRSAYQHFDEWVTSNGEKHQEWYKDNQGYENRIDIGGNGNN